MAKFSCPVCGYIFEGDAIPEGFKCPLCGVPGEKFIKMEEAPPSASKRLREDVESKYATISVPRIWS